jgi:heme-degrading monooxygenase HmoA
MVKPGSEDEFEKQVKESMTKAMAASGNLGAVFMRSNEKRGNYVIVGFWESREAWDRFMNETGRREALKPLLSDPIHSEWFEAIARIQDGKFHTHT